MNVIAFAGSSSKNSINKKLAAFAMSFFDEENCELLDLNDFEVPIYSIDREKEIGIPEKITTFAHKIDNADLLLISVAEHNGNYPAAFKSLYDWISRIPDRKVFNGTPVFLMTTSPGARGGASSMEIASKRFPRDGAKLISTYSLPNFFDNFKEGKIISSDFMEGFEQEISKVKNYFLDK